MSELNNFQNISGEPTNGLISLPSRQAEIYLREHINSRQLKQPGESLDSQVEDQTFYSNQQFWETVLKLPNFVGFRNVILDNFQITDWYPRMPGFSFTASALKVRQKAENFYEAMSENTYTPPGKDLMVNSGIGSYRFAPFENYRTTYYLCTATTDNFCHTGIPLAIPELLFNTIDFSQLNRIYGKFQFLPKLIKPHFRHLYNVPKFYLKVDKITPSGNIYAPVNITPVIFMRGHEGENLVSYCTCRPDKIDDLKNAADWLKAYANRYKAEIITNYDEIIPVFAEAPFSLQRLSREEINLIKLHELGIPVSQIVMHQEINNSNNIINIAGNNSGNAFIAKTIQDSFNQIQSSGASAEIKSLLTDLGSKVDTLCKQLPVEDAQTVKQDLETFTKEAIKEKPRKEMLDISVASIIKAAENVHKIGTPILKIVAQLLPLLLLAAQQAH